MPSRDLEKWMWSEALRMLDRAERTQRQRAPARTPGPRAWEPAVDVYETAEYLWVVAALPGVAADNLHVEIDQGLLTLKFPTAASSGVWRCRRSRWNWCSTNWPTAASIWAFANARTDG